MLKRIAKISALVAVLVHAAGVAAPASAQQGPRPSISFIRDAEIENTLREYAMPIWRAAGLDVNALNIYIVNDPALNAFVAGGQNIFLNTGLLLRAQHAGQVIGVMAHETGHISGGHLARGSEAINDAITGYIIESLLGMIAVGMAARSGNVGGGGGVGGPGASGSYAERSLMQFSRAQESSADQAGITFLNRAGISARGFLEFMETLMRQELLSGVRRDPYALTHPLSQERVAFLRNQVANSNFSDAAISPRLNAMHARMVAKLMGYLYPQRALQAYPLTNKSLPARYAQAIAFFRTANLQASLALIDSLIRELPNDPYFHELKGQVLVENQRVAEGVASYEKATALQPHPLVKIELAAALLELNQAPRDQQALRLLESLPRDSRDTQGPNYWRLMATGYERVGDTGKRMLAQAEMALARGDFAQARALAGQAEKIFKYGSPGWLRAQDIRVATDKRNRQ